MRYHDVPLGAATTSSTASSASKIAHKPGGLFHKFAGGYKVASAKATVQRAGTAFIAAEGAPSVRTLFLRSLLLLKP